MATGQEFQRPSEQDLRRLHKYVVDTILRLDRLDQDDDYWFSRGTRVNLTIMIYLDWREERVSHRRFQEVRDQVVQQLAPVRNPPRAGKVADVVQQLAPVRNPPRAGKVADVKIDDLVRIEERSKHQEKLRKLVYGGSVTRGLGQINPDTFTNQMSKYPNKILEIASAWMGIDDLLASASDSDTYRLYRFHRLDPKSEEQDSSPNEEYAIKITEAERGSISNELMDVVDELRGGASPQAATTFCDHGVSFVKAHQKNVHIVPDGEDPPQLHYVLFRMSRFVEAKEKIYDVVYNHCRRVEGFCDVSLWSLLGGAEILLRFRAAEEKAQALFHEITNNLDGLEFGDGDGDGKLARVLAAIGDSIRADGDGDGRLTEFFAGIKDSLRAAWNGNAKPSMFTVSREFVSGVYADPGEVRQFLESKRYHIAYVDADIYKYCKFFVFIKQTGAASESEFINNFRKIVSNNRQLFDVVESLSLSYDKENGRWLILEGLLPCGRFPLLKILSRDLEASVSWGHAEKESYIAYHRFFEFHADREQTASGLILDQKVKS